MKIKFTCLAVFVTLIVCFSGAAWGAPNEYVIKQFGSAVGTIEITDTSKDGQRVLESVATYPDMQVVVSSQFALEESAFPLALLDYSFRIVAPQGQLDVELAWEESAEYRILQTQQTGEFSRYDVVPLDNNIISDYAILPLLFDLTNSEPLSFGIVLPTTMTQSAQALDASIKYVGDEEISGYVGPTHSFEVNIGVATMHLWVSAESRSLVKLTIPQQGYEISRKDLGDDPAQTTVEQIVLGPYEILEQNETISLPGAEIFATISRPQGKQGELPAVVLVAGSGPTDRDGNSPAMPGKIDSYRQIAHYLTSHGMAVLRFDKRFAGNTVVESSEVPPFDRYVQDVSDVVEYFISQPEIGQEGIYLVGHSEGALLATLAANMRQDISGLVLLSGPGFPLQDVLREQLKYQARAFGAEQEVMTALEGLYQAVSEDMPFDYESYSIPGEFLPTLQSIDFQRPFTKRWLSVDHAAELSKATMPVLIIQGDADVQVTVGDAQALADALPEMQRELHILPGIDHILKMTAGEMLPYGDPNRKVDQGLLELLSDWIFKQN